MSYQAFKGRGRQGEKVFIPKGYRRSVKWLPQIGDIFPDFEANTTQGKINFFDWAEGNWVFLFGHPLPFTPVCTTEMIAFAMAQEEFADRGAKLFGITCEDLETQGKWHTDIEQTFDCKIDFPTAEDVSGYLSQAFGMIHEKESGTLPIRKSFIIDPEMRVRMIFEYPIGVGRSTDEVLRSIDALATTDQYGVATPADWQQGDEYLVTDHTDPLLEETAKLDQRYRELTPYLKVVSPVRFVSSSSD